MDFTTQSIAATRQHTKNQAEPKAVFIVKIANGLHKTRRNFAPVKRITTLTTKRIIYV